MDRQQGRRLIFGNVGVEDGAGSKFIRKIDTTKAHGTDSYPHRKLQYSADELWTNFDDDGLVQKIIAQTNARLVATSDSAETTVTALRIDRHEFKTRRIGPQLVPIDPPF